MSSVAEMPNAAGGAGRRTTQEAGLLDTILLQTRAQDDQETQRNKSYIEQFVRNAVKPGQVVSKDVETEHQVLDRRDRQEALGPVERDHARRRVPEAGKHLARLALPGACSRKPARA